MKIKDVANPKSARTSALKNKNRLQIPDLQSVNSTFVGREVKRSNTNDLIEIGYSSGLRIGDVVKLKLTDIDSEKMLIGVNGGKGRKDRVTLLSVSLLNNLRKYFRAFRPQKYLSEGLNGRQCSTSNIQKVLNRATIMANIDKSVTYHTLRHSFATYLLESGTDLRYIKSC